MMYGGQTDGGTLARHNPQRAALGEMLRNLRLKAGLESDRVEAELGWYKGKASRVEVGGRGIVPAEAAMLADLYKLDVAERETVLQLAIAARKRESPAHVADFAQSYITFERQAGEIEFWDDILIHSLVQTQDYARALLGTSSATQLDQRVADRISRQSILTRTNPPTVKILLGEAAVHMQVGGPRVMHEQIQHLLTVAALPSVSIRIMPFAAGAHRALGVGFRIVKVASPASITRVYLEGLTDATYIHEPDETDVYLKAFADLWESAADDHESATILRRRIT